VVVIDAIGEFQTLTIWEAKGNNLKLKFQRRYPHSIGLWYSAMTQRCGLKPNEEEYILMGMSAYGDPSRLTCDIFGDFVGEDFKFKTNLHRGCLDWRPDLKTEQDYFDIAAGTQTTYEILFRNILELSKSLVKSDNLVLMGGCALNCSANPISYNYYSNVWIMPAPGDNGSSIGSVLAHKKKHINWKGPYLGYNMGYKNSNVEIVDYLLENKICGIARGKSEFGPRSLGNRSLLADPRGKSTKDLVNNIKQRELFRPFAPVVLEEIASDYFEMICDKSPYMQFVVKCKRPDLFPAIVHVDGTSRVQTISKKDNPEFRELLEIWYEKTGCPILLNTSLNIKGKPILNDESQIEEWQNIYKVKIWT
jgi:carbamoyltransferase